MSIYDPRADEGCVSFTLDSLFESGNIEYVAKGDEATYGLCSEFYAKIKEGASRTVLYLDGKSSLPLKLLLYGADGVLIPNQPVKALSYVQQDAQDRLKFTWLGVLLPYGVRFDNRMNFSSSDLPYFESYESGWKNNNEGRYDQHRIDVLLDEQETPIKHTSLVTYKEIK